MQLLIQCDRTDCDSTVTLIIGWKQDVLWDHLARAMRKLQWEHLSLKQTGGELQRYLSLCPIHQAEFEHLFKPAEAGGEPK